MAKRTRQPIKKRVTRIPIQNKKKGKKNYLNWAGGTALTVIPTIIGLRSTDMDPINVLLIGGDAIPGSKKDVWFGDSYKIGVECLQAKPIGIIGVLGFSKI